MLLSAALLGAVATPYERRVHNLLAVFCIFTCVCVLAGGGIEHSYNWRIFLVSEENIRARCDAHLSRNYRLLPA